MFLEALVNGVSLGCIYALVALGFVIVFKATNVVNFSHTAVLALGAYFIAIWHKDIDIGNIDLGIVTLSNLGFWVAVVLAGLLCAVVAALLDFVLIRPMRKRRGGEESLAIITLGIYIVVATEVQRRVGTDKFSTGAPGGTSTTDVLGVSVAQTRITALAVAVFLMIVLFAVFRYTSLGVAMRSTAADPPTAALMGIRLGNVAMISWGIAGALAAVAGAFFAAFPSGAGVDDRTSFIALTAVPAAVAGGLDSLAGAVVGGMLIGIATSFVTIYADDLSFLGGGLNEVAAYFVLLLILLWRPTGLFGEREVSRV